MDEEEPKGFQVRDRRRFTPEGEARDESEPGREEKPPQADEPAQAATPPPPRDPRPAAPLAAEHAGGGGILRGTGEVDAAPPALTFASFLMGLGTQALLCLGELEDPVDGQRHEDLEGAREMIDILGLLRDRTRGNLDPTENQILESL